MELIVGFAETHVARLMGQVVNPAALELDVIIDLVDHLLKLSGVDTVAAHMPFLSL